MLKNKETRKLIDLFILLGTNTTVLKFNDGTEETINTNHVTIDMILTIDQNRA